MPTDLIIHPLAMCSLLSASNLIETFGAVNLEKMKKEKSQDALGRV